MARFVFPGKDGPIVVHTKPRGCPAARTKRLYESEQEAREAIAWGKKHTPGQPRLYVYPCEPCGGWHLTRQARPRDTRSYRDGYRPE